MRNFFYKLADILQPEYKPESLFGLTAQRDRMVASSRLGKALQALEEGDEIRRDTEDLIRRARIELNKRKKAKMQAYKAMRGGMFG